MDAKPLYRTAEIGHTSRTRQAKRARGDWEDGMHGAGRFAEDQGSSVVDSGALQHTTSSNPCLTLVNTRIKPISVLQRTETGLYWTSWNPKWPDGFR